MIYDNEDILLLDDSNERVKDFVEVLDNSCQDLPGSINKRRTLYANILTEILVDNRTKLCANYSTNLHAACSIPRRNYKIPIDSWSMSYGLSGFCPRGASLDIIVYEFGLSEAMTKVYPLKRFKPCGIGGEGKVVMIHNRDIERSIEFDVKINSFPDPTKKYPITVTETLHPGESYDLGCTEQNQARLSYRLVDARFVST